MRYSLFLAFVTLIVISSSLTSCGMKRGLYLPDKSPQQTQDKESDK